MRWSAAFVPLGPTLPNIAIMSFVSLNDTFFSPLTIIILSRILHRRPNYFQESTPDNVQVFSLVPPEGDQASEADLR